MPKANKRFEFIQMTKHDLPYYAVIFTTTLSDQLAGYIEMAKKMEELAQQQPGFLGMDSARSEIGITISYWASLDAIDLWRKNAEHGKAKAMGKSKWYASYNLKICKVLDSFN